MAASRISVVLPVYNEAGSIAACLRGLWAALKHEEHEILVIYDFDEDTTLPAIEAMDDRPPSLRLVKNELGRGAANALRAGFAAAAGDAVVTTMADLSDPPELIPAMARRLREGADVVSGSRYMSGGSQTGGPLLKRCMSQTASLLLNGVAGMTTLDATSNFRGYSKRYLEAVTIESDAGFEIALELTVKAHLAGRRVAEVPSSWTDRAAGESQFKLWKWLPNYLRWFTRAMLAPVSAWASCAVLTVLAAVLAAAPVEAPERAIASALAALFGAGAALALMLARRLRGRTTWLDLAHPVLWLAPVALGLAGGHVLLALAGACAASAGVLAFGVGARTLARAARAGLARVTDQRVLGLTVMGLLLWLSHVHWPRSTSGPALDASWEQAIGYALKHELQWGRDLFFTFGPLGYFTAGRYDADLYWTKVLWWDIVFQGCLALVFVFAILRVRGTLARAGAFLLLLLPLMGHDAYTFLAIVALAAWLLERSERPLAGAVPALALLSFIALIKFTPLLLTFGTVGVVALAYARRRSPATGLGVLAIFGAAFCAVWVLLGQSFLNLPAYLKTSAVIAGAYNGAMGEFGPEGEVKLALAIAALAALVALVAALERPRRIERLALAAIVVPGLFLAGKAGFVRHGDNAITFFAFAAAVTFLIPSVRGAAATPVPVLSRARLAGSAACGLLGLFGYHLALEHGVHSPNRLTGDWMARLSGNAQTLVRLEHARRALDAERDQLKLVHGLPRVREAVGDATVDMILSKQGVVFLNELSWHPRPVFQGYYSYAPELLAANRAFLEGRDAPRYILFRTETIDQRLPNMDDHEALLVMMRDYAPVLTEKDYLLLERRAGAPFVSSEVVLDERTLAFGEEYELPMSEGTVDLVRLDIRPTALGKALTTLAKSPLVTISIWRSGREHRFRIIPSMTRSGLIVQPFPVGQDDWQRWFGGGGGSRIERIAVRIGEDAARWFEPEIRAAFVRVEGIEPEAAELTHQLAFSSFVPVPDVVRTPEPVTQRTLRGKEFVIVGTPSELRFDLPQGKHVVTGGFGLDPKSYRKEPFTDGAGFGAYLVDAAGKEQRLWSRTLDPVHETDDCRMQSLELSFEAKTPVQLCLRTDPGPSGVTDRDLAYWHEVRISPKN